MVYHDTAHIFLLVCFQYDAATRALLRQGPVFVVQEGSESSDAAGQSRVIRLESAAKHGGHRQRALQRVAVHT